jgi:ubiquinone/menaquinone biosynthesis C-methylase UbiE
MLSTLVDSSIAYPARVESAEYRQASHEIWNKMAAGWEGWNDWLSDSTRPVTDQMVEALAPQPGETILELAAGAGVAGFLAASLLGGEGRLIMTDFSEEMVEAERRRGAALGVSGVEYRVMDAEQIDLEDESVDGVLCRWGYMLMADPAKALGETRRVLRPGGRLSFSVWGAPEDNKWASVPGRILVQRGHMQPPESGAPGIFAMADPKRIVELVTGAGLGHPDLVEAPVSFHFDSFDHFWQHTLDIVGAVAMVLQNLDPRESAEVREDVETALAPLAKDGAYDVPGVCINGLAARA